MGTRGFLQTRLVFQEALRLFQIYTAGPLMSG
jgi:hypothetical protein